MATHESRLGSLITAIGADIKALYTAIAAKKTYTIYTFQIDARLAAATAPVAGVAQIPIVVSGNIVKYRVRCSATATAVIDFHLSGTTLFTTQGNRPSVTAGQNMSTTLPNIVAVADTDYLMIDLDTGSIPSGAVLTGTILVES